MIQTINLRKTYGKRIIFENVNLIIPKHRFTFIAGANGSGKTTLLKCLIGLETYQGKILFDTQTAQTSSPKIYAIYDQTPLYDHLTGFQNIEILYFGNISRKYIEKKAESIIDPELLHEKVKHYSYGQRKKLSLLIALLYEPDYLFLDEVSNGLDYDSLLQLKKILKEQLQGITVIATGHQFDFYDDLVDSVIVIANQTATQMDHIKENGDDLVEIYRNHMG
ncbi:ABC transporter ATP-binding protein [Paenibacillus hunanensis]|uniref:ATP-binding cassette domain-containing protein n=1 Tax=Paenibacillus hunanensis TaxID=539262 RepID=UPI002026CADC|nr:ABC transporter ATP-binding protein [Paenibacillus hunanensis]MCL9662881.1 ABC transporter ATP-binding protein [Paenibacillus hunanensis]